MTTGPLIRPFRQADAPAVAALVTASVRGQWVYAPERFQESSDPRRVRLVAVQGREVIATAHLTPFAPGTPDALRLDLAGDGAAFTPLYLRLLTQLPAGFRRILGVTREDFSEQMAFFQAAGFRNAWQSWGAHLELASFDLERYRALEKRRYLQGYEAGPLPTDAPESDWDDLYHLYQAGLRDAPRNPTTTPDPLGRAAFRDTLQRGEQVFVVRFRDGLVALTRLIPRGHEVESEGTVTHPAHRGRGLATWVKACALGWARAQGYARASTGGTILNVPLLRVNTRLGYQPERLWITWARALPPALPPQDAATVGHD